MAKVVEHPTFKKKRRSKKVLASLVCTILIFLFAFNFLSSLANSAQTELVHAGKLEDVQIVDGYVIRKEIQISANANGVLSCNVSENQRVTANTNVATILIGSVDEEAQARLRYLNERINSYQHITDLTYFADQTYKTDVRAEELLQNMIRATDTYRNIDKIPVYKDQIYQVLDKASGENRGEGRLEELKQERDALEKVIAKERRELYSHDAGVFSSHIDGYEEALDYSRRKDLSSSTLRRVDNRRTQASREVKSGEPVAKIIDSYEWYFAVIVSKDWASDIDLGDQMILRFPNMNNIEMTAFVDTINESSSDAVLIMSCDTMIDPLFDIRKLTAEVIKKTRSGLHVPNKAIRQSSDGRTGVYILKDGNEDFREIDILISDGENSIVRKEGELKMYDELVIKGGKWY